ncbi:circadian locomoter output cycles protein kaput isoform X2 [Harmonia axyridis]|uniref:circadian locomoter output cycles protein kaput isoform X2 n=1 Tax=Harmonia axyridis TaxID=115357 RepID=UPI001E275667|nr:circadian locomoter output cycles protein kaput isoform X2 [Harmonia axyridis]
MTNDEWQYALGESDNMDDGSDDKDSKRRSRNLSEKKRRDQFNTLVSELNAMVSPDRKMDKSSVLKTAISLLKKHNELTTKSKVTEIEEYWKPTFLTNEEFIYLQLEAIDGFMILFSTSGQIFYTSESVISLLGYLPENLIKMTLYEITHEAERNNLYNILMNPPKEEEQVSFSCYIQRKGSDSNRTTYELINFVGNFRPEKNRLANDNEFKDYSYENNVRLIFMGIGRIQTPQLIKETALVDSTKAEFISRHSLEWKFLFLDHRAPPIIGYLPFELLGTSGYDYYHVDDLNEVLKCHQLLMQRGEGTSCYYRFLTKGQQWIWLQTRFYITYHQWNSKPEFVVCSHRVVSYLDVMNCFSDKDDEPLTEESSSSTPWCKSSKKKTVSDCTSMSAESPSSRHSVLTQNSVKSGESFDGFNGKIRRAQSRIQTPHQVQYQDQQVEHQVVHIAPAPQPILEPKHYVAAIPVTSVIATFPAPTVLTIGNNLMMSAPAQNQVQTDLQRKQAELQASIEQKQAELRRISEQLVMARLGILPSQPEQQTNVTE